MKIDKNTTKKLGKLRSLVHIYDCWYMRNGNDVNLIDRLNKMVELYSDNDTVVAVNRYKAYLEIKKLFLELELSDDEYSQLSHEERTKKINIAVNKKNKNKETRDNKGIYVGSGHSNNNKVRFPKKVRSKKVWEIFYKMFPNLKK